MFALITRIVKEQFTLSNEINEMFANAISIDHLDDEQLKTLEEMFKDFK